MESEESYCPSTNSPPGSPPRSQRHQVSASNLGSKKPESSADGVITDKRPSQKNRWSTNLIKRVYFWPRGMKRKDHVEEILSEEALKGIRRYSYKELHRATDGFISTRLIGKGGFGSVYRGSLKSDDSSDPKSTDVAVKKFVKESVGRERNYVSEINVHGSLSHPNIVQLLGWCHEADHLLLVYEFMSNGSLYSHLHSPSKLLPWQVRYSKIAQGLASALLYLQNGCVVHRDIKTSNLLLDSEFNPKLADFGLAKIVADVHEEGDEDYTMVAGTLGYIDPEYVKSGKVTKEVDIYAFGIVALEMASGRRPNRFIGHERFWLVEWVRNLHEKGTVLEAADPRLGNQFDQREMERLILVGLWCTHIDRKSRPSISLILQLLTFKAPMPSFTGLFFHLQGTTITPQTLEQGMMLHFLSDMDDQETISSELPSNNATETSRASWEGMDTQNVRHFHGEMQIGGTSYLQSSSWALEEAVKAFDIGIPSGYEVKPRKELHHPIVNGMVASLREMLQCEDEPPLFDDVFELVKRCTELLVTLGAPLDDWNSLAQLVLRALKEMPEFFNSADSEATVSKNISSILAEIHECARNNEEDGAKLEIINRQLGLLMAKLADTQKRIEEVNEELKVVEERRANQLLFLKHRWRQYANLQQFKFIPSKLSSFTCQK